MDKSWSRAVRTAGVAAVAAAVGLGGLLPAAADDRDGANRATALMIDGNGNGVGRVTFTEVRRGMARVTAEVSGLSGFHGFHIHAGGACRDANGNPSFGLAAGHLGHAPSDGVVHRDHPGDMPVLLAKSDGTATTSFETTRVSVDDIKGRTVIVHALADNYANIPARYGSPDDTTLATGDAGSRLACGAIRSGG